MLRALFWCAFLLVTLPYPGDGHATPTPIPTGRLRVEGNRLLDSTQQQLLLRGVQMNGLNAARPSESELRAVEAMNRYTFRILRQRWNMNAIRLPVSNRVWERDGDSYLLKVHGIVSTANEEGLIVILANFEDFHSGAVFEPGLPSPAVVTFWRAWASFFQFSPLVIFDVFNQPSPNNVPGHIASRHLLADWRFWLSGGVTATGLPVAGMQTIVDAIRGAGANQIIAVSGFHDKLDFQGFTSDFYIRDPNILYETHPYYDQALTDAERQANFGFLGSQFPLYAGEWGLSLTSNQPACQAVPRDPEKAADLVFQTLAYFDLRNISWTAVAFDPSSLIVDFTNYAPTALNGLWNCGAQVDPQAGMGQMLLLWMSGDEAGFGSIRSDQVASAAGGFSGPIAPGELISVYGQGVGPETTVTGRDTGLAETQVLFDGIPGPILSTGTFQVIAQVPYEVAGRPKVTVQAFYREIPSNKIEVEVVDAAPEIFVWPGTFNAAALNEDGGLNSSDQPAELGSIVTIFATGGGQTSPPGITGKPAQDPFPGLALPVSLLLGGQEAELLYNGSAPLLVGVVQVNARVPLSGQPGVGRLPVVLRVGSHSSRAGVNIWVRGVQ